jgi:rod shape-determining protein MreD
MVTAKERAVVVAKEPRRGILIEAGIARIVALGILLILAIALQSTLLSRLTFLGVIPQLVLVVVVSMAWTGGERVGVTTGFAAGLLLDLLTLPQSITGLYALIYTLVGFGVGFFRAFSPAESVWTPVFAVALASAVAEFGYSAMNIMMGQKWVGVGFSAKVAGLVVLYNTLLTPFIFPLVRRIAERYSPGKVFRI